MTEEMVDRLMELVDDYARAQAVCKCEIERRGQCSIDAGTDLIFTRIKVVYALQELPTSMGEQAPK